MKRTGSLCAVLATAWLSAAAAACGSDEESTPPPPGGGPAGSAGAAGAAGAAGGAGAAGSAGAGGSATVTPQDFMDSLVEATSCALSCNPACEEPQKPYDCPAMHAWSQIPHDTDPARCGTWDGASMPTPVQGKCTASAPTGEAVAKTTSTGKPVVLPDGRRLQPAGQGWVLDAADLVATFPFSAVWVPGTRFVLVSDDGYGDHALRVIDTDKLSAGQSPEVGHVKLASPAGLNYGLAIAADGTVYASGGKAESAVLAFTFDKGTGALARNTAKDVKLENDKPGDSFPMGMDVSPSGTPRMIVAQVNQKSALAYGLDAGAYGQKIGSFEVGDTDQFAAVFDPFAPDLAYVGVWNRQRLVEIDLAAKATRVIDTGRQPQEIVFFDANYIGVAEALSEDIAIVDRAAAKVVANVPLDPQGKKHALSPTALAFDAATKRLYATLATLNGVAAFDVVPSTGPGVPPKLTAAGVIPTYWWPTDVLVAGPSEPKPGSLFVLSGKGIGGRADSKYVGPSQGSTDKNMRGAVQWVAYPDASALAGFTTAFEQTQKVGELAGNSSVSCPGADYDFPIPKTNTEGPSKAIEHVIFIVRENKTYDAILGDVAGADGDANLVMIPGKMDQAWGNIRAIAKTFAHGDNFYHDAEMSLQGHVWTVFGRSTDYTERTWLTTWGRASRGIPTQGVVGGTRPTEGGLFDWLKAGGVAYDNMGEMIGMLTMDPRFGKAGFVSTNSTRPDLEDACYIAGRARVLCNLKTFTYVWLVNDHTLGGEPGKPNPGLMIAVNDEATGMILDGLSHSPLWKSSLLVVIEDDPQDGADHVDTHRSILVLASPWVKRGYVSHGHLDVASLHKLFAHVLGLPYNNGMIAAAAVPFDLFTSTPDYTPYTYKPRGWTDGSCNKAGTSSAVEAEAWGWDFSEPDDQPGLSENLWRIFHPEAR
jgi:hypothetical protein